MNKVSEEEKGETLEVYMDDIIIKSSEEKVHDQHLTHIFQWIRQYIMRLNPEKCTFLGERRETPRFLPHKEANSEKCDVVMQMSAPTSKKELLKMKRMFTTMSWFISKSAQHALSFYKLLRKEAQI